MRNLALLLVSTLLFSSMLYGQSVDPNPNLTPGGYLDRVFDRFGNEYSISDLEIGDKPGPGVPSGSGNHSMMPPPPGNWESCQQGYFMLWFDVGSGFEGPNSPDLDRRTVACQVAQDLSNFINSPLSLTPDQFVNVWFRDFDDLNLPANVLGAASSFYVGAPTAGAVTDNMMYSTITSGVDAYTNVIGQSIVLNGNGAGFFHNFITLNFSTGYQWNTTTAPATGAENDLYTVLLHEMIHALGFASLIDCNGFSKLLAPYNYYSRYDTFLMYPQVQSDGSTIMLPLIQSLGNGFANYTFSGQVDWLQPGAPSQTNPTTDTDPNCSNGAVDNTNCADAIQYVDNVMPNVPVFTPDLFQPPSSLSHFEDQCYGGYGNNTYFVMSNADGPSGQNTKRYPKWEERQVLCDLGYSVNGWYGNSAFIDHYDQYPDACGLDPSYYCITQGVNDGLSANGSYIWVMNAGATITIDGILDNDLNSPSSYDYLQLAMGNGTISNQTATGFDFTSVGPGIVMLSYQPRCNDFITGNITYIYIYVVDATCSPDPCNLISNSNFESATFCGAFTSETLSCWDNFAGSPDCFMRDCPNSGSGFQTAVSTRGSTPPSDTYDPNAVFPDENNNFIGIRAEHWPGNTDTEAIQTMLSVPLIPGVEYTMSFYAKANNSPDGLVSNSNLLVDFFAAQTPILAVGDSPVPMDQVSPGNVVHLTSTPVLPVEIAQVVSGGADEDWAQYEFTFIFEGLVPCSYLVISQVPWSYEDYTRRTYVFLDDIVLINTSSAPSLDLPSIICLDDVVTPEDNFTNLLSYATPPVGTFALGDPGIYWDDINQIWTFDPNLAGPGSHTIYYSYTTSNGCHQTISHNFQIYSSIEIPDQQDEICPGDQITLFASGSSQMLWQPGDIVGTPYLNGTTITVSPAATTSYSVVSTEDGGCTNQEDILVTVYPECCALAPLSLSATSTIGCSCDAYGAGSIIDMTIVGGTGDISIIWVGEGLGPNSSPSVYFTEDLYNVCAGTYNVTVTDELGCSATLEVIVDEYPLMTLTSLTIDTPDCNPSTEAIVHLDWSDTSSPYVVTVTEFSSNQIISTLSGITNSNVDITGLPIGEYVFKIYDSHGCYISIVEEIVPLYTFEWDVTPATCDQVNDGAITLSFDITDATQWTVTVDGVDADGNIIASQTGNELTNISFGQLPDGVATLNVSLTRTTADGDITCAWASEVEVTTSFSTCCEPFPMTAVTSTIPGPCWDDCLSSASVAVSGGLPPYQYSWTGPGISQPITTADIFSICNSGYLVEITDGFGCVITSEASVPQPFGFNWDVTPASCDQVNDGAIALSFDITDATQWTVTVDGVDADGNIITTQTGNELTNISIGQLTDGIATLNVSLTRTTVDGDITCTWTSEVGVTTAFSTCCEPFPMIAFTTTVPGACLDDCLSSASVAVSGGLPPYLYSWTGPGISVPITTSDISNICNSNYVVEITDGFGCVITSGASVPQPFDFELEIENATCPLTADGSVTLTLTDPDALVFYSTFQCQDIYGNPIGPVSVGQSISDLPQGTCHLLITLTRNTPDGPVTCSWMEDVVVGVDYASCCDAFPLAISPGVYDRTCVGECTGSIHANFSGGAIGTGPYVWAWEHYDVFTPAWVDLPYTMQDVDDALCQGLHRITVTDAYGCIAVGQINVPIYFTNIAALPTTPSCSVACDGSINISPTPSQWGPWTYSWSSNTPGVNVNPGQADEQDLFNLCAGSYHLEITESHGCVNMINVVVPASTVSCCPDIELSVAQEPIFHYPGVFGGFLFTANNPGPGDMIGYTVNYNFASVFDVSYFVYTDANGVETTSYSGPATIDIPAGGTVSIHALGFHDFIGNYTSGITVSAPSGSGCTTTASAESVAPIFTGCPAHLSAINASCSETGPLQTCLHFFTPYPSDPDDYLVGIEAVYYYDSGYLTFQNATTSAGTLSSITDDVLSFNGPSNSPMHSITMNIAFDASDQFNAYSEINDFFCMNFTLSSIPPPSNYTVVAVNSLKAYSWDVDGDNGGDEIPGPTYKAWIYSDGSYIYLNDVPPGTCFPGAVMPNPQMSVMSPLPVPCNGSLDLVAVETNGLHIWNFGDNIQGSVIWGTYDPDEHFYQTNGTFTVTHTVILDGWSSVETMTVQVVCCPELSITAQTSAPFELQSQGSMMFTIVNNGPGIALDYPVTFSSTPFSVSSVTYIDGDGVTHTGMPQYLYLEPGATATIEVHGAYSTSGSHSTTLEIVPASGIPCSNTFEVNVPNTVACPQLNISVQQSTSFEHPAQMASMTFTIHNNGPGNANGFPASISIPGFTAFSYLYTNPYGIQFTAMPSAMSLLEGQTATLTIVGGFNAIGTYTTTLTLVPSAISQCVGSFTGSTQNTIVNYASAAFNSSQGNGGPCQTSIAFQGLNNLQQETWNFGDGSAVVTNGPSVTHLFTANGTYTVTHTVTDDGNVSVATEVVTITAYASHPNGYTVTAADDPWIDPHYEFLEDLVIQSGVTLNITGGILQFGENARIFIEPGGILNINGTTLTEYACDNRPWWRGVDVTGHNHLAQNTSNQGKFTATNAQIEKAQVAICNYDRNDIAANPLSAGGMTQTVYTTFLNNWNSVYFKKYFGPTIVLGPVQNMSNVFYNSVFKWNDDMDMSYLYLYEGLRHVGLQGVYGVRFQGCKFVNNNESLFLNAELIGIESTKSSFIIDENCAGYPPYLQVNCNMESSYFDGLHYGVWSLSDGIKGKFSKIDRTNFNCFRGAYLGNMRSTRVTRCKFGNLQNTAMLTFDPSAMNYAESQHYGVYFDRSTGFWFEENLFSFPDVPDNKDYGAVFHRTGSALNKDYRNKYLNTAVGSHALNANRGTSSTTGLKMICNQYTDNSIDIGSSHTAGETTSYGELGISQNQGTPSSNGIDPGYSPGNHFFGLNASGQIDIANSEAFVNYYRYTGDNLISTVGNINLLFQQIDPATCPTHIGPGRVVKINEAVSHDLISAQVKSELVAMIDAGDTEGLTEEIIYADYNEALELYYTMIGISPSLSEEAMVQAISKEYELPPTLLTLILASNPSAAKSPEVQKRLDERILPLSEYQRMMIDEGLYLLSLKEQKEAKLSHEKGYADGLINEAISLMAEDETLSPQDVIDLAVGRDRPEFYYLAAEIAYGNDDLALAESILDIIPSLAVDKTDIKQYQDYMLAWDIMVAADQDPSSGLSSADEATLITLAEDGYTQASGLALSLLLEHTQYDYNEPLTPAGEFKSNRVRISQATETIQILSVYPNPAEDLAFVKIISPVNTVGELKIVDLNGRVIRVQQVQNTLQPQALDITDLASGKYYMQWIVNNQLLESQPFEKLK